MAEYIEREALMNTICNYLCNHEFEQTGRCNNCYFVEVILAAQSADVAPVRHGRWVDNHCTACGMMPMGDEIWEHCDFKPHRFDKFMDYCPSCGAKMDLEENE